MVVNKDLRIAWLTPPRNNQFGKPGSLLYWEPLFEEFQKEFPNAVFFTQWKIHSHYKKKFNVHSVGKFKWLPLFNYKKGHYKRGFILLSPKILLNLFKTKPRILITSGFNLWTILSALFKKVGRWKLIILLEGSSPTVDYRDSHFRLFIRKIITKFTDAFITNTRKGVDYLQDYLNVPRNNIYRVVHEIPNMKVSKKPILLRGKKPRFLYVGHLIPRKGVDYLLDAWSKLQELTNNGSLWIIGDGNQKDTLKRKAKEMGLKNIHFVGRIENKQLGSWYQPADVFVFPTLEDTWGVVTLEAMSFGKPILCSKHAGTVELVQHGKNGFIFEPRDTDQLAKLMSKFIVSSQLIGKFGQESKKIIGKFTHSCAVASFKDAIEKVMES